MHTIKINHYTDDSTLISEGSERSFTAAQKSLDRFSEISGLHLNRKKDGSTLGLVPRKANSEEKL